MMENGKSRKRRQLSPEEKWEIFLEVTSQEISQADPARAGLTGRELEVLALVAAGLRNAQIAERLVVSERTIEHHVSTILRKLDASTRGEAAATASRLALIDPT